MKSVHVRNPFAIVSGIGHFRSSFRSSLMPHSSLSSINEYLAIDSGGNVND